jgi:cytochrome P450
MADEATSGAGSLIAMMDAAVTRHPYDTYRQALALGPVTRVGAGAGSALLVSGHAAEEEVLRNPDRFSSASHSGQMGSPRPLIPIEYDPPEQKKYRKLLDPLFAPQRMQPLAEPVEQLVNELIDGFGDATEIDFAAQFSIPLPSRVFLALMGLPYDHLDRFLAMKDGVIRTHVVLGTTFDDPQCAVHKQRTAQEICEYFDAALDERVRHRTDDVLSGLLDAEVEGRRLTREEMIDICFLLLVGGLDTVSASLDCFFQFLAEHPDHRRLLVADPSLVPGAVEELLRRESPVMLTPRTATVDTELAGCPVHAGDQVFMFHGAANADPEFVADGFDVRFDREANRHLSFGGGVHRCLGSNLARLELRTALRVWHTRIPDYRIPTGVELQFTPMIRSTSTFPMELGVSI